MTAVRPMFWRVCNLLPSRKQTTCAVTSRACVHMITAREISGSRSHRNRARPRGTASENLWPSFCTRIGSGTHFVHRIHRAPGSYQSSIDFYFAAGRRLNHAAKVGKRLHDSPFTGIVWTVASIMSPNAEMLPPPGASLRRCRTLKKLSHFSSGSRPSLLYDGWVAAYKGSSSRTASTSSGN